MSVNVFSYTGSSQTYTVPDGVFRVFVDLLGAAGAGGSGNQGARLQGFLRVVPGQVLNLYVGGQGALATNQIGAFGGFNGGGTGGSTGTGGAGGEGGGGATDIRVGGTALSNRICVAGGGGGSGRGVGNGQGGPGGGTTGGAGTIGSGTGETGGGGGTQAAGGAAGTSTGASSGATAGTATTGGFGSSNNTASGRGGGGGGGGYFCGGGGGSNAANPSVGGGGGSSYIGQLTDAADFQGDAHALGDGQITIYTGISISVNVNSTFTSTDLTMPSDVTSMAADLIGGMGGGFPIDVDGGLAGHLKGTLAVTPGQAYRFTPGGLGTVHNPNTNAQNNGGANGGGNGIAVAASGASGAGGGGASDIRTGGTALANRVCVAAGGGGISGGGVAGGDGGGTTGGTSTAVGTSVTAATGGTQAAGGTHGNSGAGGSTVATNGALGVGGNGAANSTTTTARGGGGGGAGYYGGGGGGSIAAAGSGSGGGGGSNFVGSLTSATDIQGDAVDGTGEGSVSVNFDTVVGIGDPNNIAPRGSSDIVNWVAGTACKVRYPNVVVTDDIIVLYQSTNSSILPATAIVGWNSGPSAVVGGVVRLSMWWKRASGLEAGDLDIPSLAGGSGYLLMESYSGCVTSGTPYTASTTNSSSSANTALNSGSILPVASADDGRYYQVSAWSWGTAQSGVPTVFGWTNSAGTSGSINSFDGSPALRGIYTAQAYYTATTGAVTFTATLKTSSTWAALTFDLLKQPPSMNGVQSAFESSVDSYWTTNNQLSTSLASWFARGEIKLGVDIATNTGYLPKALGAARNMIDASLTWRMRAVNLDQGPAQLNVGVIDQAALSGTLGFYLGYGIAEPAGTGAVLEAVVNGGAGGDIGLLNLASETGAVWCNITESGGIVTFSYSVDGRRWDTLLSTPWAGKVDLRSCVPFASAIPQGASSGQAALHQFYWGPVNVASPHQRPIGSGLRYNQCPSPNFDYAATTSQIANKLSTEDSTFEGGTVGTWASGGVGGPTLSNSATHADVGTKALLITWGTGAFPYAAPAFVTGLGIGRRYFLKARVWVPVGHPDVKLFSDNGTTGAPTSIKGAFTPISVSFIATASTHQLQLWPDSSPTSGQQCWVDSVSFRAEIDFWVPAGSIPPIIEPSTDFANTGTQSLKITWMGNGTLPGINTDTVRSMECIVGHQYVVAFRHLATNVAYPMLAAILVGGSILSPYSGFPNDTTRDGTWKTYIGVFTATATLHDISLWPTSTPAIGQITYLDSVVFEDIDTFNPRAPIFDGNSAGGGWELHPNTSRSYLVAHSEAVATSVSGTAVSAGTELARDSASGTAVTSGTALASDSASGTAATSATIQSTDKVLGVALATLLAVGADFASGSAVSSGTAQSTDSASGALASAGVAQSTDSAAGSAATSAAIQSATSVSGAASATAVEQPQNALSGSVASAGPVIGRDSVAGSQDSSGATTAQPDVSHTSTTGSTVQPTGQSFNTALASLVDQEFTTAQGQLASSGTSLATDPVQGSLATSGQPIGTDALLGSALITPLATVATSTTGTASTSGTTLGGNRADGVAILSGLVEALMGSVDGLLTAIGSARGATFADGVVVSAGDAIFGFHGFVVAEAVLTNEAAVATAVFAQRQITTTDNALGVIAGLLASAGQPVGTHTRPGILQLNTTAQPTSIFDGQLKLTVDQIATLLVTNNHQLIGQPELLIQVTGLVQSLGTTMGVGRLLGALTLGQLDISPGVVQGQLHADLATGQRTRADGVEHLVSLIVQVHGDFFLWNGTVLRPVEFLGLWDGTQLTHTSVDGVFDGSHTIPQGFIPSTV